MKQIVSATLIFMFCSYTAAYAQHTAFGFTAGATLARLTTKTSSETMRSDFHPGFTIGLLADVPIISQVSFQPSLNFTQKGGLQKDDIGGTTTKYAVTFNYLELPLNVLYKTTGEKGHFIAGLGPSFSYGLSGKTKITVNGQTNTETIHFGNSQSDDLKAFEFGGSLLAGYESNTGLFVEVNYNVGISNLSTDPDVKGRNSYFGLRVGYFLYNRK